MNESAMDNGSPSCDLIEFTKVLSDRIMEVSFSIIASAYGCLYFNVQPNSSKNSKNRFCMIFLKMSWNVLLTAYAVLPYMQEKESVLCF